MEDTAQCYIFPPVLCNVLSLSGRPLCSRLLCCCWGCDLCDQQKMYADRHRTERSYEVGDLVFLRLQPYRQSSLKQKGAEKRKPRYYGPYRITRKVGQVVYELELPEGSKIHNVFHVSCLKRVIGQQVVASQELPPLDDEGRLATSPEEILQVRERKLRKGWSGSF
jgi:hypothetical protein